MRALGGAGLALAVLALNHAGSAATPEGPTTGADHVRRSVRAYREAHEAAIVKDLASLLAIPNVASEGADIRRNARHLAAALERRGLATQLLEVVGAPPAVFGEMKQPGAAATVVFYMHYDGQPVDAKGWGSDPWVPVLRDAPLEQGGRAVPLATLRGPVGGQWRLYGRSASDDKGPIIALLTALDALRAAGEPLSMNLKVFLEGEEENGSPHLQAILEKHAGLLASDVWLFCDGPVHPSRRMQIYFGARGSIGLEATVYGPLHPLHSGHYGNWAPNPATLLAQWLASLHDKNGRIAIEGYADDVRPPTAVERQALSELPEVEIGLRESFALGASAPEPLMAGVLAPAINVRGLRAGNVGEGANNAIPSEATASFDLRLVPAQSPAAVRRKMEEYARKQGFFVVGETPDLAVRRAHPRVLKLQWGSAYAAARTSMELPIARALVRAVQESAGAQPLRIPTVGGSLPMSTFADALNVPVIGLPIVNHDNNQHAANENIRVQNLWDGIELFAGILARFGAQIPAVPDAVTAVSPKYLKVLLDNERVRALEYHDMPGDATPLHSHRGDVLNYALNTFARRNSFGDGTVRESVRKQGDVWFTAPILQGHGGINTGKGEARVLILELKDTPAHPAPPAGPITDIVKAANPKNLKVLFENHRVRAYEYHDLPGDETPGHGHDTDVFYYALTPFKKQIVAPGGTTQVVIRNAGDVWFRHPGIHGGTNIGTTEARILIVEIKNAPAQL